MAADTLEQQLRFRWNDHMQHLSKVLTLQRLQEQYCDITLVSEDGYLTKAHQAVLASTSTYFERVLGDIRPEQHPMVVLRGANLQELTCLLDYMYQGKTQVDQGLIESVLEVADLLGVKGLSGIRSNPAIQKFMAAAPTPTPTPTPTPAVPATPAVTSEGVQCAGEPSHPPASPGKDGDLTQTSGIDLSMAKNEPRSPKDVGGLASSLPPPSTPREGGLTGVEGLPLPPPTPPSLLKPAHSTGACRKRRRLDSPSSEDNLDSASDPDWGRIGSQVEEAPRPSADAQPRTITLTAVSTATAAASAGRVNGSCPKEGEGRGGGGGGGGEGRGFKHREGFEDDEEEEEEEEISSLFSTASHPSPPHCSTSIVASTTMTTPDLPPSPSPPQLITTTSTPLQQRGGRLLRPQNAVKRPMNKFLLFYRHIQPRMRAEHPYESFNCVQQRIAALWRGLPESEKQEWETKALRLQAEHKQLHPDYTYCPKEAAERRRQYMRLKREKKEMFHSPSLLHDHHHSPSTATKATPPVRYLHTSTLQYHRVNIGPHLHQSSNIFMDTDTDTQHATTTTTTTTTAAPLQHQHAANTRVPQHHTYITTDTSTASQDTISIMSEEWEVEKQEEEDVEEYV